MCRYCLSAKFSFPNNVYIANQSIDCFATLLGANLICDFCFDLQIVYVTYTYDDIVSCTPANKSLTITVGSDTPPSNALVFFTSEVHEIVTHFFESQTTFFYLLKGTCDCEVFVSYSFNSDV